MKIVRNMLVALAGLIAILVVVGLFLPSSARVERSTTINAPAGAVYSVLSGFARFTEWSPWTALDPDADYVVSDPAHGEGASFSWQSDRPGVGSGTQQIIEAVPDRRVRIRLDFGPQDKAQTTYLLDPVEAGKTRVTWRMDIDFGYDLIGRYAGLMFEAWVGKDYEQGLANLKHLLESEQISTSGEQ